MIPYSRPKRPDLYTLAWSKLHTLHSRTYPYSPYMAVPPPPAPPGFNYRKYLVHNNTDPLEATFFMVPVSVQNHYWGSAAYNTISHKT